MALVIVTPHSTVRQMVAASRLHVHSEEAHRLAPGHRYDPAVVSDLLRVAGSYPERKEIGMSLLLWHPVAACIPNPDGKTWLVLIPPVTP